MTNFVTYQTIETKVLTDLDLLDESFISGGASSEMMGYCNEAIHIAESLILTLCEDYFETSKTMALVSGTAAYSFPSDIYGDKLRKIVYNNGSLVYLIKKMNRSYSEIETAYLNLHSQGTQLYKHKLNNDTTNGRQIIFYPTPTETSAANVTLWYIRSAKKITAVTDTIDIPEFHLFIEKYMKMMCYEKEGHPNWQQAKMNVDEEKTLMIASLSEREPDVDTTIEEDFSFYQEHL